MQLLKDIKLLVKRFFKGTPQSELNYNNFEICRMEVNYLRYQLKNEVRKNKGLGLKVRLLKLKSI